jgi:hypothetical protein
MKAWLNDSGTHRVILRGGEVAASPRPCSGILKPL